MTRVPEDQVLPAAEPGVVPLHGPTFVVALAATVLGLGALWRLSPPFYWTNDDVWLRRLVEGTQFPGEPPTGYLGYAHAGLGWLAVALQQRFPAVPVWDIAIALPLVGGLAALLAVAWTALGTGWLPRVVAVVAVLVPAIPYLDGLHYTISAALAGAAGVIVATLELLGRTHPRRSWLGVAGGLMLAGLLLRPLSAEAGIVVTAVLMAPIAALDRSPFRSRVRRCIGAGIAAVLLIGLVTITDRQLYAGDPVWREYYQHHRRIVALLDWSYGKAQAEPAIRQATGWTHNDFLMLDGYWGVDASLFGMAQVKKAADAVATMSTVDALLARARGLSAARLRQAVLDALDVWLIAGAVVLALGSRRSAAAALSVGVLFLAVYLGIEVASKEPPFRLMAPLETALAAVMLVAAGTWRRQASTPVLIGAVLVALALAGQQTRAAAEEAVGAQRQAHDTIGQVDELLQLRPSLLIFHADSFPMEAWWRPFARPPRDLPSVQLTYNNQYPLLQDFLVRTQRRDLLRSVCADPSILVVADAGRLERVTESLREHTGTVVHWDQVFDSSFRAWRCSPGPH